MRKICKCNKDKLNYRILNKDTQEVLKKINNSLEDTEVEFNMFINAELAERAKIIKIEQKALKNIEDRDEAVYKKLTALSELCDEHEAELKTAVDHGDRESTMNLLKKMTNKYQNQKK